MAHGMLDFFCEFEYFLKMKWIFNVQRLNEYYLIERNVGWILMMSGSNYVIHNLWFIEKIFQSTLDEYIIVREL